MQKISMKRMLSALLCLVMLCGILLVAPVSAAGETYQDHLTGGILAAVVPAEEALVTESMLVDGATIAVRYLVYADPNTAWFVESLDLGFDTTLNGTEYFSSSTFSTGTGVLVEQGMGSTHMIFRQIGSEPVDDWIDKPTGKYCDFYVLYKIKDAAALKAALQAPEGLTLAITLFPHPYISYTYIRDYDYMGVRLDTSTLKVEPAKLKLTTGPVTEMCTLYYEPNGGMAMASQTVAKGTYAEIKEEGVWGGHKFVAWCEDEALTKPLAIGASIRMDTDKTVYAKWDDATMYTLTYVTNGGSAIPAEQYFANTLVTLPYGDEAPTKANDSFDGWYDNSALSGSAITEIRMTGSKTVYAKWAGGGTGTQNYTVTFMPNGGSLSFTSATVPRNGTLAGKLPTGTHPNGYTLSGAWNTKADGTGTTVTASTPITGNMTLYAQWNQGGDPGPGPGPGPVTQYTLTYETNGGTAYAPEKYNSGTTVQLTKTPARAGYDFTGWYSDEVLKTKITNVTMSSDKKVYAGWQAKTTTDDIPYSDELRYEPHFAYVVGYVDNTFRPTNNIARSEAVSMIYRLLTDARRDAIFTSSNNFSDVNASMWYNKAVSSMTKGDYVKGYPDGTFGGARDISRAEFATILMRFFGEKDVTCEYSDVSTSHWAYKAIATATSYGWLTGYPDGTFRPDQAITRSEAVAVINRILNRGVDKDSKLGNFKNFTDNTNTSAWYYYEVIEAANDLITREQFAAIMYRYANFKGYNTSKSADLSGYADASAISDWALAAMKWANAENLITGRTATTLVPRGDATRAEAAAILKRFIENVK